MGQIPRESRAERYRRRAKELRAKAKAVKTAGVQRELLVIARQYERLAEEVKRGRGR
jgi:hypothetical protein